MGFVKRSRAFGCVLLLAVGACGSEKSSEREDEGGADAGAQEPPGTEDGAVDAGDAVPDADAGDAVPDAGTEPDAGADPEEEPTAKTKGRVTGYVSFAGGGRAAGLEVVLDKQRYTTDTHGAFEAKTVSVGKHQVHASSTKTSAAQLEVTVQKDREVKLSLSVLPLTQKNVANAAASFEVEDAASGVKVKVPSKGLVTKAGAEVKGSVTARYSVVKSQAESKALPGGLKADLSGKEVELEAYGMLDLRFYQDDEELVVASEIEVQVPLFANPFSDGAETDAYTFDPVVGRWKAEGKAKIDKSAGGPGYAVLKPRHLSWWGVALPFEATTCLSGRVESATGEGEPYLSVHATGMDHHGSYATVTDEEGAFCLSVKAGGNVRVLAGRLDEAGEEYRWQTTVSLSSEAAQCGEATDAACAQVIWEAPTTPTAPVVCADLVGYGADHVYVMSSEDAVLDGAVLDNFVAHGQAATLGVPFSLFDGSQDLSAYDAVYFQANANWSTVDMPLAGQTHLTNYVRCGGGLVTTEWVGWKTAMGSDFVTLAPIFPFELSTVFTSTTSETYTASALDSTVQAGLPDSFTFLLTSYSGTQTHFDPRPGAREFYRSFSMEASGLLGWDYEQGRVASFSTTVGDNELTDDNFSRLIANTVNWVQKE